MHHLFFFDTIPTSLVPEYTTLTNITQDIYPGVLANTNKGNNMSPKYDDTLFVTIDDHISTLYETLNTTIAHLLAVTQHSPHAMLPIYLSTLVQPYGFVLHPSTMASCVVYTRATRNATRTLLLFSNCPPQVNPFARWSTFVARLLTFALYQEFLGDIPLDLIWFIQTTSATTYTQEVFSFLESRSISIQEGGCLYDLPCNSSFPTPFLALGTKGLLRTMLTVRTATREHASEYGSILPNAVWRLLWALNSIKNAHEEVLIAGFYDAVIPMEDEEIALLRALPDAEKTLKQQLRVKNLLLELHGFQLHYAQQLLPSCTITTFQSGEYAQERIIEASIARYTIPAFAQATLELQLVPQQTAIEVATQILQHLATQGFEDVQAEMQEYIDPQFTPSHTTFVRLIANATHVVFAERAPLLPFALYGNMPYPLLPRLNIPVVFFSAGDPHMLHDEQDSTIKRDEAARLLLTQVMKQLVAIIGDMAEQS